MSTIIKEVYDAFIAAGVEEEKATKAAAAIMQYEEQFRRLADQMHQLEQRMTQLEGRFNTMQWMVGTNIVLTVGVLFKLLTM